eukprot:SAG11_NODE_1441_length_4903_cov_12.068693_1_plen_262_part_00
MKLGVSHVDTLRAQMNIGTQYGKRCEYSAAHTYLSGAISGFEKMLATENNAEDRGKLLCAKNNLAILEKNESNYEVAMKLLGQVVEGRKQLDGDVAVSTLKAKMNLGIVLAKQGKRDAAIELFRQVVNGRTQNQQLGPDHISTLRAKMNLATALKSRSSFSESVDLYEKVIGGYIVQQGADAVNTLNAKMNLAWLYREQGNDAAASPILIEVESKLSQKLGSDHDLTRMARWNRVMNEEPDATMESQAEILGKKLKHLATA